MPKPNKSPAKTAKKTSRKLALPNYKTFKLSKRIKQPKPKLTGSFRLLGHSFKTLWQHKKLFLGITLVYLILSIFLVKGLTSSTNITDVKATLSNLFGNSNPQISSSFALFSLLLTNASSSTTAGGSAYQSILAILTSLATIWALRQALAAKKGQVIRIRDAFYKGMGQLIPFILVLLVIGLELLPLVLANFLYGIVFGNGLATDPFQKGLWLIVLGLLALGSLYMVASSIIALYIVTLTDTTPMQALRSARDLVRFRRWAVIRKLLFLPIALLVIMAVIVIPTIMILPAIAEWLFFGLSIFSLVVVHSYIYNLYRELL